MPEQTKKRLDYIDWAKAISITLIVMGHMLPSGCLPKTLAYSFHVPIFALIGGLLFGAPDTWRAFGKKLLGICRRMLIPYVIWFAISAAFYWQAAEKMQTIVKGTATTDLFELLKYFVFYENVTVWNDPLWFMPCYILLSVLFLLFVKLTKGSRIASGILSLMSFGALVSMEALGITVNAGEIKNVFGLNNYFLLFGFMAAGYAIRPLLDRCAQAFGTPRKNPFLYAAGGVFLLTAVLCMRHNRVEENSGGYYTLSTYSGLYNGFLPYILFALALSVSLLLVLMLLPRCRVVNLLSRNSMFLMFTHYFFFLDLSFFWLKGAAWTPFMNQNGMLYWELDMSIGIRDGIFIMVCYVLFLLCVDAFLKKYPKARSPLGYIGLQ